VKLKGPRHIASVKSDYVFVVEKLLTKELRAAHVMRLLYYQDKELNVTPELSQAAKHNEHELYFVSKILGACYSMNKRYFMSCLLRGAVSQAASHLGAVFCYG
jgi:hypothetical protein